MKEEIILNYITDIIRNNITENFIILNNKMYIGVNNLDDFIAIQPIIKISVSSHILDMLFEVKIEETNTTNNKIMVVAVNNNNVPYYIKTL